jgi:hypothetical protein
MDLQFEVGERVDPEEVASLARTIYGDDPDLGCPAYFGWLYGDNPRGAAIAATARLDGALVGHYAVVPVLTWLDGKEIQTGQGVNAMTRRDQEGRGIFARLVSIADEECRRRAIRMVYAIPGSQAAPWYRTVLRYQEAAQIPLWLRPVRLAGLVSPESEWPGILRWSVRCLDGGLAPLLRRVRSRRNPEGLEIRLVDGLGPGVDALWERGKSVPRCLVARNSHHLSWRFLRCPTRRYRIWGAFRGEELCAYLVARERRVRRRPWARMGSLVDAFAEPGVRGARGMALLVAEAVSSLSSDGVGVIMTQALSRSVWPALRGNGFFRAPRREEMWMPLMVRWLDQPDPGLKWEEAVHFMPGDHDMG